MIQAIINRTKRHIIVINRASNSVGALFVEGFVYMRRPVGREDRIGVNPADDIRLGGIKTCIACMHDALFFG